MHQIEHLAQQVAALEKAEAQAQTDLGRAALALASGQKSAASVEDLEAEITGLQAQRRRLEAALIAAQEQAVQATESELQALLDEAIGKATDAAQQIAQAQALDKALRAALIAAHGLAQAGQDRRQHLVDAGRALAHLVPEAGHATLSGAAALGHLADGTAARRSNVVPVLNAIGEALGLQIALSEVGVDPTRSTADMLAADTALLAQRLKSWNAAQVRAAFQTEEA